MSPYQFRCPDCSHRIELDEPSREATVENGCPFCGTTVETSAFASC